MDIKVNAVVLRAVDYNDNDKILTLLTPELGKISAGIKGVKKAGAKLKFAAQPFCFGEYILTKRGERYTVINCSECQNFYDLSLDIKKYFAACAATEVSAALTYEGDECAEIFYALLRTFSQMSVGDECSALIKFLVFAMRKSGYGISVDDCTECGSSLINAEKLRFDMDAGAFTCYDCGSGAGVSRVTYNVFRKLDGKSYAEDFITVDGEKRALKLLREYSAYKLNAEFTSLSEYIRLI